MSVGVGYDARPPVGVVVMPMMKEIVAAILQLLYKLGDGITNLNRDNININKKKKKKSTGLAHKLHGFHLH